jgi:XTP/dITP diphosphohydrolase
MQLVLASNNTKKLAELGTLFAPLAIELLAQSSLGISEADEPHISFVENALAKARHAAQLSGLPAIADDSGLSVAALGGAPGVISAHYAELGTTAGEAANDAGVPFGGGHGAQVSDREALRARQDSANNRRLLAKLAALPPGSSRAARFVCVLVAIRSADDPEPLIAFGRWEGELLTQLRGTGGFGYDPLLFIPALGQTVAELPAAIKNRHSHRALACIQMVQLMREVWQLG